jgi:hypothetical protein
VAKSHDPAFRFQLPLPAILVAVGRPRTKASFLHHLVAQDFLRLLSAQRFHRLPFHPAIVLLLDGSEELVDHRWRKLEDVSPGHLAVQGLLFLP